MLIRNLRPFAVEIPDVAFVDGHDTVDVPDELGASLCEQVDAWAPEPMPPASPKRSGKTPATDTPADAGEEH